MTTRELREKFNDEFELDKWPSQFKVDNETYANICQDIFTVKAFKILGVDDSVLVAEVYLGPSKGVLFKGVELILDRKEET